MGTASICASGRRLLAGILVLPAILLVLAGAPFLCVGLWEVRETQLRLNFQSEAQGTVIESVYRTHTDPEDSSQFTRSYHPVVRFSSGQGQTVVFTDGVGSYPEAYQVGETVEVLYDPQDPEDAMIPSWSGLWGASTVFIVVGMIPIGIAIVLGAVSVGLFARRRRT